MKKIFLKKYWLAFVSVLAVAGGIAWACAGGDWEYERPTNFVAEGIVDSSYRPFFYSFDYYYHIGYDTEHNTRFNTSNVRDWSAWFDHKVANEELDYLLNTSSMGIADSAAAFAAGKMKVLPPAVRSFKIFTAKNAKVAEFLSYLAIAKKCEGFAVVHYDPWDAKTEKKRFSGADKLNAELLSRFTKAKDQFLKQRYWFQLVRSYFFNGPAQQCIDMFEKNANAFAKNPIYYRAQSFAAGAYYGRKDYSKANYYYSKVYDGCNKLKTVAHFSFHPQEEKDWKNTLALCKDKNEQVTLWQMLGTFYGDETRSIQEIYKLDPASEKLELLLLRAINKAEAGLRPAASFTVKEFPDVSSSPVYAELLELTGKIARAANTSKPYLWNVAAGYLNTMNGGHETARVYYERAQKMTANDPKVQMQFRLFNLMNKIALVKRIDTKFENEILNDLYWLSNQDPWNKEFRFVEGLGWIRAAMAYKYQLQKDYVKSECFLFSVPFYLNNGNVEAMKSFLNKQNKTAYEQLCRKVYDKSTNDLWEYQGIQFTYTDKLAEAIAAFQNDTANGSKWLQGNPFNGRINDCHDCDHAAPTKTPYTKLLTVKKMKEMQDKVSKGEDVYNNAMLLGNAYYNITHYGNARYFYECKVIGSSGHEPFMYIDAAFNNYVTGMQRAAKYYSLAMNAATNSEQKAKSHYMLAKCERNEWYNAEVYSGKENSESSKMDFKAWEGFKALKEYSNTRYYQDVLAECGYFKTYIQRQ
jgi:hypothetical protein